MLALGLFSGPISVKYVPLNDVLACVQPVIPQQVFHYDFDCATGLTEEVANRAEGAEGDSAAEAAKTGKKRGNLKPTALVCRVD